MNRHEFAGIRPVHHTAAYELVVDQIRRVIYLGRYLPGDKLPPERELAKQLGVSRTTVREAIRLLEGESLIKVKRGATGGIIVAGAEGNGTRSRRSLTKAQEQALRDIFEYRYAIECNVVRLAAEKRTANDLRIMEQAVDEMAMLVGKTEPSEVNIAEYKAADTRFHLQIAEASKNPLFIRSMEEIRSGMFLPVGAIFERLIDKVDVHHRPILEAIEARDPDTAERQMRDHIDVAFNGLKTVLQSRNSRRTTSQQT